MRWEARQFIADRATRFAVAPSRQGVVAVTLNLNVTSSLMDERTQLVAEVFLS